MIEVSIDSNTLDYKWEIPTDQAPVDPQNLVTMRQPLHGKNHTLIRGRRGPKH